MYISKLKPEHHLREFEAVIESKHCKGQINYREDDGYYFLCQNKESGADVFLLPGYKYSWAINPTLSLEESNVYSLKLIDKTLDNLEVGDEVMDKDGDLRRVLGVCGEMVSLSEFYKIGDRYTNNKFRHLSSITVYELKEDGWIIYQPDIPEKEIIELSIKDIAKKEGVDPSQIKIVDDEW